MYDEETDSYIDAETLFLRYPKRYSEYQPSFDKPYQLHSNTDIKGYLENFSSMYYEIFHGTHGDLQPNSIYALGEYHVDIPQLYRKITENLLTTFGSLSTADLKRHFLFQFVETMLGNYSQELYSTMIGKGKLNKLTKQWISNILTSLINSQATSESPAKAQIQKIRTEILQEIIKSIEDPYRLSRTARNNPGLEDICSNQTQNIAMLLDYLIETDSDGTTAKQLQHYIKESGLDKLETHFWIENPLSNDLKAWHQENKERDMQVIYSNLKFNITQTGNKELIAIMDGKLTEKEAKKKEEKKEAKKEAKKEEAKQKTAIEAPKVKAPIAQAQQATATAQTVATPQQAPAKATSPPKARQEPLTPPSQTPLQALNKIEKHIEELLKTKPNTQIPLENIQFRLRNLMGHVNPAPVSATTATAKQQSQQAKPSPQVFHQAFQQAQDQTMFHQQMLERTYQQAQQQRQQNLELAYQQAQNRQTQHGLFEDIFREVQQHNHPALINTAPNAPQATTAKVTRELQALQQSIQELVSLDPVKTGIILDKAVQFNTYQIPDNIDLNSWVNDFSEVADRYANTPEISTPHDAWATEFAASQRTAQPSRTSAVYQCFKTAFKDLVKQLPNSNELTLMLLSGMIQSANVAQAHQNDRNISSRINTPQFAQFEQNLQSYLTDVTRAPTITGPMRQSLPRLNTRQGQQSRTTRHIPGMPGQPAQRQYGGDRKKKAVKATK
jgi:hypothetical protein